MKALCLDKPGPIESLYLTDREEPTPKADEIRVKVRAVGLNPVDYKIARTGHPAWHYPFILGLDVAGIIDSVGEN
ncbi:MAG: alcohol dehydrogenase catalytic domain-containing protein, partial [Candidatus Melainabacteria bacterium]|nr:alcohol dehydrogenase catalytic domain-containing protein [Candidatus Melainabacteria bacterium]